MVLSLSIFTNFLQQIVSGLENYCYDSFICIHVNDCHCHFSPIFFSGNISIILTLTFIDFHAVNYTAQQFQIRNKSSTFFLTKGCHFLQPDSLQTFPHDLLRRLPQMRKTTIFFAENWQKSQKIVIITSTPDNV
jgi:hypothetical protein